MIAKLFFIAASLLAPGFNSEATTNAPFSIQERNGNSWLAKPNGEKFFSLGVCVVNEGASPERLSKTNPGYAAFQHYQNSNLWAEAALKRLKAWKFTTVGGWSDYAALRQCRDVDVAFIPVLAMGMMAGAPWKDMWDTNVIARMHQIARDQILAIRDDPRLLGYYSDNEMGWWNATLFRMTLEQPPTSGQRQRLLQIQRAILRLLGSKGELCQHIFRKPVQFWRNKRRQQRQFLRRCLERDTGTLRVMVTLIGTTHHDHRSFCHALRN